MGQYAVISFPDGTKCYSGPNCLRHSGKNKLSADFAKKNTSEQLKEMAALKNPLSKETPVDIDTTLANIYGEYFAAYRKTSEIKNSIKTNATRLKNMSPEAYNYEYYNNHTQVLANKLEQQEAVVNDILDEAVPYEAEFNRRGGWTRAFLVKNVNGHVHKTRDCSTCTTSTQFGWLTEYSGGSEETVVDDAGSSACTVCYPSAPVESLSRPSRIQDPEVVAKRSAREEARLAKLREANIKGITAPDGSVLMDGHGFEIKSARTAEITAVQSLTYVIATKNGSYMRGAEKEHLNSYLNKEESDVKRYVEALAAKRETTYDEEYKAIEVKAQKKYKKEWL
jgi:hypothetical protein